MRPKKKRRKKTKRKKKQGTVQHLGKLDLPRCISIARDQGWDVALTKNNHWRFKSPKGPVVFTSSTASDWRAIRNHVARLRRAGLQI